VDRHIGVAINVPEPFGRELQTWRERLGDPNSHRIVPHITLVPPAVVAADELPKIEEHLLEVAAAERPFEIRLRGSATFMPVSPVVFVPLTVGIADCERLAGAVRYGPLDVDVRFPYHPHVTVAHDLPDEALRRAFAALSSYQAAFTAPGFSLFERGPDEVWRPQRDFAFSEEGLPGPPPEPTGREPNW
jgi:2'-5' RNA ligase